ncbi:YafY family protein [Pleionea sp. CnH1-48]|uniref:helix-turn-helix transcriptional regulator n=1 Tax=Pleionea sp. CnH1-48 TaxID=2954494 RepID=UPI0020976712|nr:WYL domain-containing protein [Pleionea sp. CnH1-48]MCO7225114.1 WYL domain-containing protein [Pleionea sp. CnH1-48]
MPTSPDTLIRKIMMLQRLPTQGKMTAGELCQYLEQEGFPVSRRTVERDLKSLEGYFGVCCDNNTDTYGWSVDLKSIQQIGQMGVSQAITYFIAEKVLSDITPNNLLKSMQPMFNMAKRTLSSNKNIHARWPDKVMIIPEFIGLQKKPVKQEILDNVFDALLSESQIEISYTKRGQTKPKRYQLSPLGIVVKGPIQYLVAYDENPESRAVKSFVLHRMVSCRESFEPISVPQDFTLSNYVEEGAINFSFKPSKIRFKAIVDERVWATLIENPLGEDQQLKEKNGKMELQVTVANTYDFERWVLGYASHITVLQPKKMVDKVKDYIAEMIQNYDIK